MQRNIQFDETTRSPYHYPTDCLRPQHGRAEFEGHVIAMPAQSGALGNQEPAALFLCPSVASHSQATA